MRILFDQGTPVPLRQHLPEHQSLAERKLAVLVLPTTSWPRLLEQVHEIASAVIAMKPGEYLELKPVRSEE